MNNRSNRILNMVISKNNSYYINSQNQELHVSQITTRSQTHPDYLVNHEPTDIHDDSFDTNSIPDSQTGLDISLDSIYEKSLEFPIKPNKIIEESSSDSDDGSTSSSDSDSDTTTSLDSTEKDFSSDDSVKDPDYRTQSSITNSDSDSERAIPDFSHEPGTSGAYNVHSSSSGNIVMINQGPIVSIEPANIDSQPPRFDTLPTSVGTQPASVDSQPTSVGTQPASVDSQPSSIGAFSPCVDTDLYQRCRKRKANPMLWKKNQAKFLRNCGKAYISASKSKKHVEAKKMGPVCGDKCKLKCSTKISDEERLSNFKEFWATGDLLLQRQFVYEHMTKITPKYRYTREGSNRKNSNHAYYLHTNEKVRVCKIYFMHTLGISDKFIRTVINKHSNLVGVQTKDYRGRQISHNKTLTHITNGIKAHINSIPRIESHYCRAQTQREYIEGGTNVTALHRDYVEKCKSEQKDYASYQIYYNIFKNEFNISFWQPKKDQCDECIAYANAEDKMPLQPKYELHLKEKSLARAEKERDKQNVSDTFIVAVYDLQAVMPCPRGDVSSFYYISKINLLNFTITELETKNTTSFVWHEGEGARGVNELGSCVFMYLKSLHDKANESFDVVFYSDNCCGQQKNKFMLAMYQHAIRIFPKLRGITHKYLIKGHTQNEGDSVHSVIGRNISNALKSSPIYVPDQYITLIKTAKKKGKPYTVKELTHDSFFDLKSLAVGNYTITEDGGKIKWTDIKVIKIDQQNPNKFFIKTSYEDTDFKSVSTLTKRLAKSNTVATRTLKKLYKQKLTVPETKTQGILNLIDKNVIPKYYEYFYTNF